MQLFQLLRIISPETNAKHPNKYRQTQVMVGEHICPEPSQIPSLMNELFYQMSTISNTIVKSVYLHHEMIRIHPFADGNGRVTRIAKNWILMFDLYPPIFIDEIKDLTHSKHPKTLKLNKYNGLHLRRTRTPAPDTIFISLHRAY